ncbi:sugar transferase [Olivibacter sp. SDN3]|uniref:sugar transferase n=1 Tax=Olivibacter sp. SDN3 TaxID=2764720 RepID=UPI001650D970|nr:sugar transferase [Olivibacter sp. SDN3]QNL51679.1 sugar transferase [Olivibacter sp. SDN3]
MFTSSTKYYPSVKRLFDFLLSLLAILVICSWLFPLIAIVIRLNSPGPIFYRQQRWGKGNRPFWCLKFRTIYIEAPRLTNIGVFLRRSRWDKLPLLFNVLRGELSIVGPRPHTYSMHDQAMKMEKNHYKLSVKPGITGWAQVNGFRGESAIPELWCARVKHDLWYIENQHFLLDIKIVMLTIRNILLGSDTSFPHT